MMITKMGVINFATDLYIYMERMMIALRIWFIVAVATVIDRNRLFNYIGQPAAIVYDSVIIGTDPDPIMNARIAWWLWALASYDVDRNAITYQLSDLKLVFKTAPRFLLLPLCEVSKDEHCEIDIENRKFTYQKNTKSAGLLGIVMFKTKV